MKIDSLQKLYEEELKDLHSMERQIIQALPRMIKAATASELKEALSEHLEVTKKQLDRLDRIFEKLGKRGMGKKCKGMEGVLEDGKEMLEEDITPELLDMAIIGGAQHVEHYEIAGYGTASTHAGLLGENEAEKLLKQSLEEEKEADKELTELAESKVNTAAAPVGVS
jgi:ferritin-like metal-binding protein YciE